MKIDELVPTPSDDEWESDDEDEDVEQDLTDALSLLDDCSKIFEEMLTTSYNRRLRGRVIEKTQYDDIKHLAQEVAVFLDQYDMGESADKTVEGNVVEDMFV